jgi:hypothetical protein
MKKVIIKLRMIYPYSSSLEVLIKFCHLWGSTVLQGGSHKTKATISMPEKHFIKIFKQNPKKQKYSIPNGMEGFVDDIRVKKIIKDKKGLKIG